MTAPRGWVVTCDRCETRYTPIVQERPDDDGGLRLAFTCPSCSAEYPVAAISPLGVELRTRLQRMDRMGQTGKPQYTTLLARYRAQVTPLATTGSAAGSTATEPGGATT